jgi:UDP:flavonoid glycosyltransferase YjiC (YdhE family)
MPESLNVLLVALGSHGDVHPFVGIGQAMRARGHRVCLIANAFFRPVADRAGLDFSAVGTEQEHREIHSNPDHWHPARAGRAALNVTRGYIRPVYRAVASKIEPGRTVVVSSTMGLGARIAQEKFGIPTITAHVAPIFLGDFDRPPMLGSFSLPEWTPHLLRRVIRRSSAARAMSVLAPTMREVMTEAGVPAVDLRRWAWESPNRIIGLFPPWFAPPQPQWPAHTRLTGFIPFDQKSTHPAPPGLQPFLDAGHPPIVFTPGSGMWNGERFFAESVKLCQQIGRRGVLVSPHRAHIPPDLPSSVLHVEYVAFSDLLPRSAAIVHHAGVGTGASAMAAGIPQLLTPFALDQFTNAALLSKLGVAQSIPAGRYTAEGAAGLLQRLLESPDVSAACRAVAARFPDPDAITSTCVLIEEVGSNG